MNIKLGLMYRETYSWKHQYEMYTLDRIGLYLGKTQSQSCSELIVFVLSTYIAINSCNNVNTEVLDQEM